MDADNKLPPSLQAVIDLFEGELGAVNFPDVDKATLEQLAERVTEGIAEVAVAEAALTKAREALEETQSALAQKCQRALAYARIYAEDKPELRSEIEAAQKALAPAARPQAPAATAGDSAPPKRRGRPKAKPADTATSEERAGMNGAAHIEADAVDGTA